MNILFVCHRFPFPPNRGGKIRPFHMIRHLARDHRVTVASLARSADEAEAGRGLAEHCDRFFMERIGAVGAWSRMMIRLLRAEPSSMGYFHSPRLAKSIRQELAARTYDLVIVHCSSVAHYVEHIVGVPKILDFGDMDSQKWLAYGSFKRIPLKFGYYLEGLKLQLEEMRLARTFDYCTCTTRAELRTLDGFGAAARTGWFPNGVDDEFFAPADEPYDRDKICFIGRMDYFPNQDAMFRFCGEVWPALRHARPALKLEIVGAAPSRQVLRLGDLPGVTVTGTVPDVRPHVRSSALTVAPLNIARGTQNKILESMAMGVPVVSSRIAAGGIDAEPGEHVLTASAPAEYVEAIGRLLDDPSERQRYAESGRRRVQTHHNWAGSMKILDDVVDDCLAAKRPSSAAWSA